MSDAIGPLSGVTVIDLTRVLAGPTCTQMLGDLGADVIKFERPGAGDDTRKFAPPFVKDADGNDTSESSYFMGANRNTRSVAIDIANPEGAELVRRMVKDADMTRISRPVTSDRARLRRPEGHQSKAGLLPVTGLCRPTLRTAAGYDFLIQGMGGLMSITGEPDANRRRLVPIADIMAGMYAGGGGQRRTAYAASPVRVSISI